MKNIFIIVAILAGGYFFWQQKFNDNQTEASTKDDYQSVSPVSNISSRTNERVYSTSNISKKLTKKSNLPKLPLNSKMRLAEKNQNGFKRKANALLKKMAADHLTSKKVVKYRAQFNDLVQDNVMKLNSSRLPCPGTVGKSSYSAWSNKFNKKERELLDSFVVRMNKLTSKVKGLNYISQNP